MVDFKKEAWELQPQVVAWRRHLHQNPELLLELPKTTAFVVEQLGQMGYSPRVICKSGIEAVLEGAHPGKTLLLRADMDALPLQEDSGLPYASQNPGVCHACGHDTHTAMLLGAAKLLMEHRDLIHGRVKLMFQPGEEGGGGAKLMVDAGILEGVDACLGFHCVVARDHLPTGTIGYTRGAMMASADMFKVTVQGKGSHGAAPEAGVSPINILCHIFNALQSIESYEKPRSAPLAMTIGQISAGKAGNVIPNDGFLCGSIRSFDEEVRTLAKRRLVELSQGVAALFGGSAQVEFLSELPATVNDPEVGDEMFGYMQELVGQQNTRMLPPIMGSEDFSEVLRLCPGAFFRISLGDRQEGYPYITHHPKVTFNEDGMPNCVAAFAHCTVRWLENHRKG